MVEVVSGTLPMFQPIMHTSASYCRYMGHCPCEFYMYVILYLRIHSRSLVAVHGLTSYIASLQTVQTATTPAKEDVNNISNIVNTHATGTCMHR